MKVVILAGGFGTRLSEFTDVIPKPMAKVGDKPIIWHVMNIFAKYGHNDFYIACGYKSEVIKDYFLNYRSLNSDFSIDLSNGQIKIHNNETEDWKITLVDTGRDTMTGGRVKRLQRYVDNDKFFLTYGDGLADIDINSLLDFHVNHKKLATVTAVRPAARFGELNIKDNVVKTFQEKPQITQGWINGGFFVLESEFLDFIKGDATVLEKEPLEKVTSMGELMAYTHEGFWQCMDTKRDLDLLNEMWSSKTNPW